MLRKEGPFRTPSGEGLSYRLYFLDGLGHITRSHEFLAVSDEVAIGVAQGWREGRRMELWERGRMVKRWG